MVQLDYESPRTMFGGFLLKVLTIFICDFFEINNKAFVENQWFGRTVTYSDARFAYEEAQAIIETKKNFHNHNIMGWYFIKKYILKTLIFCVNFYLHKRKNFCFKG